MFDSTAKSGNASETDFDDFTGRLKYDDTEAPDDTGEPALWWSGRQWADEAGLDPDEPMREALDPQTWSQVRRACRKLAIDIPTVDATFGDLPAIPAAIPEAHTGVTRTRAEVAEFSEDVLLEGDPHDIGEQLKQERAKRFRARDRISRDLRPQGVRSDTVYSLDEIARTCGDDMASTVRAGIERHNRMVWNTARPHRLTEQSYLVEAGQLNHHHDVTGNTLATMVPASPEDHDKALAELAVARRRHTLETDRRAKGDDTDPDEGPLYVDIGALLDDGLPEPPTPDILRRSDGVGLLYRGEINLIYGDPEDGKTMISLAGCVGVLRDGGTALFIDLDNNGVESIVARLVMLGAPAEALRSGRFRYCSPGGADRLEDVITDSIREGQEPDLAVLDCVGELVGLFGGSNDSADDFTRIARNTAGRLARAGTCVVLIDHMAKSKDSRDYGAGGTMAKRRVIGGTQLCVSVDVPLRKDHGGSLRLSIRKDRHGGLRRHCYTATSDKTLQYAGTFLIEPGDSDWRVAVDPMCTIGSTAGKHSIYLTAARQLGDGWTITELAKQAYTDKTTDAQRKATERAVKDMLAPAGDSAPLVEKITAAKGPGKAATYRLTDAV